MSDSSSTLVIQLDDGTHRVTQWGRAISIETARAELAAQQRLRLHAVVRATWFIGHQVPLELPL